MKRGMSHIEMVFAFLLFIGAAGFAVFLLRTVLIQQEIDIQSDLLLERIMQQLSAPVTKQLFVLNVSIATPYYALPAPVSSVPVRVLSLEGTPLRASHQGTLLIVERGAGTSLYLISSEELDRLPSDNLLPLQPGTGTYGAPREEQLLTERQIEAFAQTYLTSYASLTQTLALPPTITFSFIVANETGVIGKGAQEPPRGVSVQSSRQRRAFIYKDGREAFVSIEVRVW
jgi:hypothetical protein